MKKAMILSVLLVGLLTNNASAGDFTLSSPQLQPGGRLDLEQVFSGYGCAGKNISPALNWENAPGKTGSFAILVYDPDAPTGRGWWHWIIFNIPAGTGNLPANAGDPSSGLAPAGSIQGKNDFGQIGYGGACPPQGNEPHRYQFTIYALDVENLPFKENITGDAIFPHLNRHTLEKAALTVYYSR